MSRLVSPLRTDASIAALAAALATPGYRAGNYYWGAQSQANASSAIGANTLRMSLLFVAAPITVSELVAHIAVLSVSGKLAFGIYAHDPSTNRPTGTALASTGDLSTTLVGLFSTALGASVRLTPGWYWLGAMADNATVAIKATALAVSRHAALIGTATLANLSNSTTTNAIGIAYAVTYGVWPDLTAASATESAIAEPLLGFKVSAVG